PYGIRTSGITTNLSGIFCRGIIPRYPRSSTDVRLSRIKPPWNLFRTPVKSASWGSFSTTTATRAATLSGLPLRRILHVAQAPSGAPTEPSRLPSWSRTPPAKTTKLRLSFTLTPPTPPRRPTPRPSPSPPRRPAQNQHKGIAARRHPRQRRPSPRGHFRHPVHFRRPRQCQQARLR